MSLSRITLTVKGAEKRMLRRLAYSWVVADMRIRLAGTLAAIKKMPKGAERARYLDTAAQIETAILMIVSWSPCRSHQQEISERVAAGKGAG